MGSQGGTLYAIGAEGTPLVKIGCTTAPIATRLRSLQNGHPFCLKVLASMRVEADLHRIEAQIHRFLVDERAHGEWFDIPIDNEKLESLIMRAVHDLAEIDTREVPMQKSAPTQHHVGLVRLRYWREKRGLTLQGLEARTRELEPPGISFQQLSAYERGTVSPPLTRLILLARTLNITMGQLVSTKTNPPISKEVVHA